MKKTNYSYIGITFIILVFGIIFIPKIIDRISNNEVSRQESRSNSISTDADSDDEELSYLVINNEPKKVADFSFTNQNGETITNANYDGKVYLVEFFFTTCPTICPRMSRNLVDIQSHFEGLDNFGIASFTINPETDTPEVLKEYATKYGVTNPNWHFLTGDQDAIYDLANVGFNLYAAQIDGAPGGFEHSGNFALIDQEGFIRSRKDQFGNPKIYYKGVVSQDEKYDDDGEEEEISILIEDIKKLLKNNE